MVGGELLTRNVEETGETARGLSELLYVGLSSMQIWMLGSDHGSQRVSASLHGTRFLLDIIYWSVRPLILWLFVYWGSNCLSLKRPIISPPQKMSEHMQSVVPWQGHKNRSTKLDQFKVTANCGSANENENLPRSLLYSFYIYDYDIVVMDSLL